jgi:hypothetical protein
VLELVYTAWDMRPFARDLGYGGEPFGWDEERRAHLRAQLDAFYCHKYGLTEEETVYVLDPKAVYGDDFPSETFRVLKENERKKYGEYRTQRLVLEYYRAWQDGDMSAFDRWLSSRAERLNGTNGKLAAHLAGATGRPDEPERCTAEQPPIDRAEWLRQQRLGRPMHAPGRRG